MESLIFTGLLGYILGLLTADGVRKNVYPLWERVSAGRPIRVERTVYATTVNASIEPEHIPNMWRSRMRAFLFHAEMCRTPCNARDLQARTGLTRPKQWEYIDILVRANLIDIPSRGKAIWKTDWHVRRKTLAAYPYPRNIEPPNFRALGVITDGTDRTQNRQSEQV